MVSGEEAAAPTFSKPQGDSTGRLCVLSSSPIPQTQLLGLASLMQRPDQSLAVQTILNMPRNISSSCGVLTLMCVLPAC